MILAISGAVNSCKNRKSGYVLKHAMSSAAFS